MRLLQTTSAALIVAAFGVSFATFGVSFATAAPQYTIYNIGVVGANDSGSQGYRVSTNGIATGRSFGNPTTAFTWTESGGRVGLPNLASPARAFSAGNGVNAAGTVVGTGTTTSFGSSPLPLIWKNGTVAQLPLPAGEGAGRANDINDSDVAVGSIGGGSTEYGVLYSGSTATVITAAASNGSFLKTAFGINNAGLVAGVGLDPNNAARNVGLVYNSTTNTTIDIGALPGLNGALAYDVSEAGHVVGASMLNQGSGTPFIWTSAGGISAVPLPGGTSQGSLRGVNSDGWAVGTASSAFAIPFLFDGTTSYSLQTLLPAGTGWDLSTNTSSSALGISEDGVIVGTGVFNGAVRAYAMVPVVPEPTTLATVAVAGTLLRRRR